MRRHFYSFAAYVNVIIAVIAATEAAIFSTVDQGMYYLDQYPTWILGSVVLASLEAIVMSRYLSTNKYRIALYTGAPYYAFVAAVIFINYLLQTAGLGTQVYIPVLLITLVLQILFGASVAIETPGEHMWLKVAGIYAAAFAAISLALSFLVLFGTTLAIHSSLEKLHVPTLWANVVPPILLAVHFYRERKKAPTEPVESPLAFSFGYPILAMSALYLVISFGGGAIAMQKWLPQMDAAVKKVAEPFEARAYVNAEGDSLKYRLFKPVNLDSTKTYPIVVALHGSSGTGNDNYKQVAASVLPEFLTHGSNTEKYPAFIFVPQCPFATSWGGAHPLPGIDKIVIEAMTSVEKELPVDTTRRYVGGISLGGYGAWHFMESYPEKFAAAIPICGVGNPANASKCAKVPVWAFHGDQDERVPVSGSRDMIDALKKAGGNPNYTEYPDTGHDISRLVVDSPGLLDWLFAQKLNPQ